jgi:hypothetical protein
MTRLAWRLFVFERTLKPLAWGLLLLQLTLFLGAATYLGQNGTYGGVQTIADGTSLTCDWGAAEVCYQNNAQSAGTLSINQPTGTPTDGQRLTLRIKSSAVQTLSFAAIFRGSTDLPLTGLTTTGGGKVDYFNLWYNNADTKIDLLAVNKGF